MRAGGGQSVIAFDQQFSFFFIMTLGENGGNVQF